MNNFDIILDNGDRIKLSENDLANSGGEGKIYVKNNFAYKIYFEQHKAMPKGKIAELNKLTRDNIIKPLQVIYNTNQEIIGYQMIALNQNKCFPLTRFFTNDFRQKHNIDNNMVVNIIKELYYTFENIHENGCLIVDGNEMNFLVSEDFTTIYFIDVDSYGTENYKATAYNPNTLDPLTKQKNFNEESDWYIFGILFCQIVLGIHPFKGKYTGTSLNINNRNIEDRMVKGVSIFRNNIKLNKAVRELSLIPQNMLSWLESLFNNSLREKPPLISIINDVKVFIDNEINDALKTVLIDSFNNRIDTLHHLNGYITTHNGFYYNKDKKLLDTSHKILEINNNLLFVKLSGSTLYLFDQDRMKKTELFNNIDDFYIFDNQLFIFQYGKISSTQVGFRRNSYMAIVENTWPLYQHKRYNNIILSHQNNRYIAYYFHDQKNSIVNFKNVLSSSEKIIDIKGFSDYIITLTLENNNYLIKIFSVDEFSKNMTEVFHSYTDMPSIDFVFTGKVLVGKESADSLVVGYYNGSDFIKKHIGNTYLSSKLNYFDNKVVYTKDNDIIQLNL
jgi:hypothetical protein